MRGSAMDDIKVDSIGSSPARFVLKKHPNKFTHMCSAMTSMWNCGSEIWLHNNIYS